MLLPLLQLPGLAPKGIDCVTEGILGFSSFTRSSTLSMLSMLSMLSQCNSTSISYNQHPLWLYQLFMSKYDQRTVQPLQISKSSRKEEVQRTFLNTITSSDAQRTLQNVLSVTDLKTPYNDAYLKHDNHPNKQGRTQLLRGALSKSPSTREIENNLRNQEGKPQKRYVNAKRLQREELIKVNRDKGVIQNAYYELTNKYFGVLSQLEQQKQKHRIERELLEQEIRQLREMVTKSNSKEIHHIFQVPSRQPPLVHSKIISEMDEVYESSSIYKSIPSMPLSSRIHCRSVQESNLSSLELHSTEVSCTSIPSLDRKSDEQ